MRRAAKAALAIQIVAIALAGCSNGADKPAAALLDALDALGLHKASYDAASPTGDGFRVSRVKGTDDAGRPVAIEEILAVRPAMSGESWRIANVIVTGVTGETLSARSIVLVDMALSGRGAPAIVGSYRATDVRGVLYGHPYAAGEVIGSLRGDGTGEVAFTGLATAGDTWDGQARLAPGPVAGSASVSLPGLRTRSSRFDIAAVLSGITPLELMASVVRPGQPTWSKVALVQASVEGNAPALPLGMRAPDPAGFRDPTMRALAEALSGMVGAGVVGGGVRLTAPGGIALSELGEALRAPDAYRRFAVTLMTDRMPSDVVRKLVPLTSGRGGADGQAAVTNAPR